MLINASSLDICTPAYEITLGRSTPSRGLLRARRDISRRGETALPLLHKVGRRPLDVTRRQLVQGLWQQVLELMRAGRARGKVDQGLWRGGDLLLAVAAPLVL